MLVSAPQQGELAISIHTFPPCPAFLPLRESLPKQVDKKSRVPEEEKGVWGSRSGDRGLRFSRRRKGQIFFFPSTFLSLSHIKHFFSLSPELMITQQTAQFKGCTRDYITTMYPA